MSKPSIASQLAAITKQRELLAKKESLLKAESHGKVLSQIIQLAKDAGLTIADITEAFQNKKTKSSVTSKRLTKPTSMAKAHTMKGVKLPAKYKNPLNPAQTWTGRGVDPSWVSVLREAGQLESALIQSGNNPMN
jgi:DNA-binding protein H-NS